MRYRVTFLGVGIVLFAALAATTSLAASPAKLSTEAFLAACSEDEVVTGQLGTQETTEVTPKQFCDCVGGKYQEGKLGQKDVDMLTKMRPDLDRAELARILNNLRRAETNEMDLVTSVEQAVSFGSRKTK